MAFESVPSCRPPCQIEFTGLVALVPWVTSAPNHLSETYQIPTLRQEKKCFIYKPIRVFVDNCECQILRRDDKVQRWLSRRVGLLGGQAGPRPQRRKEGHRCHRHSAAAVDRVPSRVNGIGEAMPGTHCEAATAPSPSCQSSLLWSWRLAEPQAPRPLRWRWRVPCSLAGRGTQTTLGPGL